MSKRTAVVILYTALLVASIIQVLQSIVVAHFFDPEHLAPYRYGILTAGFAYLFAAGFVDSIFYFISGKYATEARKYVGKTPLTLVDYKKGSYSMMVLLPGFKTYRSNIKVDGSSRDYKIQLEKK